MHFTPKLFTTLVTLLLVSTGIFAQDTLQVHQWLQEARKKITKKEFEAVMPLVEKANNRITNCKIATKGLAGQLEDLGIILFKNNLYTETVQCFRYAIRLFTCTDGEISKSVDRLYNNSGVFLRFAGHLEESLAAFKKSLSIKLELYDPTDLIIAKTYSNMGVLQSDLGYLDDALNSYQHALAIKEKAVSKKSETYLTTLVNIAALYLEKQYLFRAKEILAEVLKLSEGVLPESHSLRGVIFSNLASIASFESDYKRSEELQKKAIDIKIIEYGKKSLPVAEAYANLAATYYAWGKLENSEEYNFRSLSIKQEILKPDHYLLGTSYHHLGSTYSLRDSFDQAIDMFHKAAEVFQKLNQTHYILFDAYYNIGYTCFKAKKYKQANIYFNKGLAIALQNQGSLSAGAVSCYLRKAQISEANQSPLTALSQLDSAIYYSGFTHKKNRHEELVGHQDLLESIVLKAFLILSNDAIEYDLKLLWETLQESRDLENTIRTSYMEENSKQAFSRISHMLYEALLTTGIRLEYQTYDPEYLFSLSEASKANILLEAVLDSKAKKFAEIPGDLIHKADSMKLEINYLEKQLRERNSIGPDSISNVLSRQLIDRKIVYEAFVEELESIKKYADLKQKVPLKLSDLRKNVLDEDQVILEYFVGKNTIFAFLLSEDNLLVKHIPINFPFDQWVRSFLNGVSSFNTLNLPETMEASYCLYERLFAPFEHAIPSRLIIIPDGPLNKIPFEALIKVPLNQENKYNPYKFQYLIHDFHISYCYSANLLKEMTTNQRSHLDKSYLGIAPFHQLGLPSLGLLPLHQSSKEVKNIKDIFSPDKSTILLGGSASRDSFLNMVQHYKIVHLSTHVKIDEVNPQNTYIAFAPSTENEYQVYLAEIYGIPLTTDMAVLSACETAVGGPGFGEGVISISRAFAYSGVKNIVSTLWELVDNEKSRELLEDFYKELIQNQMSKDKALWKAKINFLNSTGDEPILAHPYFWSGIITIGDVKPIE